MTSQVLKIPRSKFSNFAAFAFLLSFGLMFSLSGFAETCGQLAGVRGSNVEILRMQRGRKTNDAVRFAVKIAEKSTTPLECDDVVLAGADSSARLLLAESKLSLGPNSRIELSTLSSASANADSAQNKVSLIGLTYGKLRALVNRKRDEATGETKKINETSSKKREAGDVTFEIKTFSAVAGVRGTDFFVSYDPRSGLTQQATIEGAVEVTQAGTQAKALVEGGHQVAIETTPQAVQQAQDRIRSHTPSKHELPTQLPTQLPSANAKVAPLKVVAFNEDLREELRQTSASVADDADFTTKKAIEALGQPSTWTIKRDPIPDSLKKLKNEY